jgi:small-conductance mechanosensitive channel
LGIIIIGFIGLGMLGVTAQKLLLGGAITGVIVGIAAQQSLGNVFSGLVLMFAHPFRVGDFVRVRSGALGGVIEGKILNLGLTYVKIEIDGLPVNIPNSTLLAAAVGPADKQS